MREGGKAGFKAVQVRYPDAKLQDTTIPRLDNIRESTMYNLDPQVIGHT